MDTIKKLIRCDLIMLLHSGKAAVIAPVVLLLLFCGIMILAGASFVAGTAFVMFGVSLVSLLLNTEKTSGCTPLFGILPAERQTVAAARFVLCGGILTAALILCALCMEIALAVMEQDTDAAQLFISLFGLDPERVSANTFHRYRNLPAQLFQKRSWQPEKQSAVPDPERISRIHGLHGIVHPASVNENSVYLDGDLLYLFPDLDHAPAGRRLSGGHHAAGIRLQLVCILRRKRSD